MMQKYINNPNRQTFSSGLSDFSPKTRNYIFYNIGYNNINLRVNISK